MTLAPSERVADALKLMCKPALGRPTLEEAIEVCKRDPGISAVVGGEVRRVGTSYLLSVRMVEPESGAALIVLNGESESRTGLLPVIRKLSHAMREKVGETSPAKRPSLDKVTTQSLRALKLYSDGHALAKNFKWPVAEVLFREAVALDPEFASAQLMMAWSIRNQDEKGSDKYMPFAERALALAKTASEQEALFIRGSYHSLKEEHEKATPFYEVLLQRYPDHPWVVNNLQMSYSRTGESAKRRALNRQLLTLRPNHPFTYWLNIGECLCPEDSTKQDTKLAMEWADRAVELTRQQ